MSNINARIDAFITEEVRAAATRVEDGVKAALVKKGMKLTGALAKSIKKMSTDAASGKGSLGLGYYTYGRFVDMGARPGYTKGVRTGTSREDTLRARRGGAPKKRIWYSREKWGQAARLAANLSNKFVDTTIDSIVGQLTSANG